MDELLTALATQTWRSGEAAHDPVSAALELGLPQPRIDRLVTALLDADVWDAYRTLVDAQALTGDLAVADAHVLAPPIRGTVRIGAARCLPAAGRRPRRPCCPGRNGRPAVR